MILPSLPRPSSRFVEQLAQARAFPEGWWHGADLESATTVMADRLHDFGIDIAFPIVPLQAMLAGVELGNDDDEDALRRGSIALVLGEVNRTLIQEGASARFFQFADDVPGWETDEPVWLLLTDEERDQLVANGTLRPVAAS